MVGVKHMIPLLILGLLKQNPGSYGYELLALMEKGHYKYIVNFTKGSFYYNLQQLEEKQYIQKIEDNQGDRNRETHNYIITELGNEEFDKLMNRYGSKTDYINFSFYAAMLFYNLYEREEFIKLIEIQMDQTQNKIDLIEQSLKNNNETPYYFRKMLENSYSHHKVNIEWFKELLGEIKKQD